MRHIEGFGRAHDKGDAARRLRTSALSATARHQARHVEIELAAARRLPTMVWLTEELVRCPGRGRPADKRFALAVLEHIATLSSRPEVQSASRTLRNSPLAMLALDHPDALTRSCLYEQIKKLCARYPSELTLHANVEMIRQLAERVDESGRPLHRKLGSIGIVDGTMIEADLPQRKPGGPAEREAMLADRWQKVGYVIYTDSNGNIHRQLPRLQARRDLRPRQHAAARLAARPRIRQ